MKYLKDIIKSLFIISNAYIIYVIFSKCFNIFSEFKIVYIFLILILISYILKTYIPYLINQVKKRIMNFLTYIMLIFLKFMKLQC